MQKMTKVVLILDIGHDKINKRRTNVFLNKEKAHWKTTAIVSQCTKSRICKSKS